MVTGHDGTVAPFLSRLGRLWFVISWIDVVVVGVAGSFLRFLRGCLLGESYITILIDDGLYWLRQSLWALRLLLEAVSEEVVHFSPGCRRVQAAVCRLCLYCFLFLFCVVVGVSV